MDYPLLHKLFFDAVDHFEFIHKNPVKKKFKPTIPQKERSFLEPDEVWRLLFACDQHFVGAAIWVMALTGLRVGEALALQWGSVDLIRKQIVIKAAWNKKIREMQPYPKGRKWGRVPMPEPLIELLANDSRKSLPHEFVCRSVEGGFLHYESVRKHLKLLCQRANVPVITPHELRHSATELYFSQSANLEDVRRLLNHQSLTAIAPYIHRTDHRLQGIAEQIQAPSRLSVVN